MFRYIGLAWDESLAANSATALELAAGIRIRRDWGVAMDGPGLQVFVTGTRPRVNDRYPLQGDQGVVLGKLFSRRHLDSAAGSSVTITDAEAARIRQSAGGTLVQDFWGRYVAFFRDTAGETCVLRDPTGTLPCFVIRHRGVVIVFSWLEDILEMLPAVTAPSVDWDAVEAFLLMGALGGHETALDGVTQVLPGEVMTLHGRRSTLLWNAVDIARASPSHSGREAEVLLRDSVRAMTRAWASCYETLLLRLSGGVDSSILLSCLAPGATPSDVLCVNYHSPGSNSDERAYARLAAARAGRDLIERERNPDFALDRLSAMARMPTPVNHVGWMNAHADARLAAAHSAGALFTGAGGDSLFFEFPRPWPAADYLQIRGWDAGFVSAAMDAAQLGKVSVWKAIGFALAERARPSGGSHELEAKDTSFLAQGRSVAKLDRERFVHPHLRGTTLPIGKQVQTAALMHPLGYYDPFERSAAPELVNPLLSQPLVELCLSLPTYLLTQGGRGRALARKAFASDLPRQIAMRRSKGGMEEHVKKVLTSQLDHVRGVLLEGELVRRGVLDRARIEEVLSGRPTAYPGALGQIHALLATEAWLSRWRR
jgi:asparagine synthase (glutamine-hydrolysing)